MMKYQYHVDLIQGKCGCVVVWLCGCVFVFLLFLCSLDVTKRYIFIYMFSKILHIYIHFFIFSYFFLLFSSLSSHLLRTSCSLLPPLLYKIVFIIKFVKYIKVIQDFYNQEWQEQNLLLIIMLVV